jgi:hypothetical protein
MRQVRRYLTYDFFRRTVDSSLKSVRGRLTNSRESIAMRFRTIPLSVTVVLLGVVVAAAAQPPRNLVKPIPSMSEIKQVVLGYFQAKPDYRAGDLITREEVEPLLGKLQKMGLPLADAKQILDKLPSKNEFLATQLSTPNGRKFMRQICGYKNGYDRVDRLSRIPRGEQTVRDLIRGPDGYKMIEYMTNTPGGKHFADEFASVPNGKNFNAPTGRIYTADQLLARLEQSWTAAEKAAKR